jgi:hypothetical protein
MISPDYYRDARMAARDHVMAKILVHAAWGARVLVLRVYRGPLRFGARLDLHLNFRPLDPPMPGEPLYSDQAPFRAARYVEAFLDGDPPDVVMEQVKFLRRFHWRPTGDPTVSSYGW